MAEYLVPVVVEVDLDTRSIVQVVVCDDELYGADADHEPVLLVQDGQAQVVGEEAKLARAILDDTNIDWPAWQFGW